MVAKVKNLKIKERLSGPVVTKAFITNHQYPKQKHSNPLGKGNLPWLNWPRRNFSTIAVASPKPRVNSGIITHLFTWEINQIAKPRRLSKLEAILWYTSTFKAIKISTIDPPAKGISTRFTAGTRESTSYEEHMQKNPITNPKKVATSLLALACILRLLIWGQ